MPSLASVEEFGNRIPGGIPPGEEARAQAALDDASALVRAVADHDFVDPENPEAYLVPEIVAMVVISAARRAFINPDGVTQEGIDGASASYGNPSPDIYLTKAEEARIRKAVGLSGGGLWTQATTRGDTPDVGPPMYALGPPINWG